MKERTLYGGPPLYQELWNVLGVMLETWLMNFGWWGRLFFSCGFSWHYEPPHS